MKRWEAFLALCGYLRTGLLNGVPRDDVADVRWELLIEASSHHYVTPALAWCLRGRADIPPDVSDYFDAVLTLNHQRNEALTEALVRIGAALNAVGIEPVLLKGAARLVDQTYPAAKLRYLGDIDVLISDDRSAEAASALKRIGFDEEEGNEFGAAHHHLPLLRERDTGAGVEIHTELTRPRHRSLLPAAWLLENTQPFELQDVHFLLPDPTRSAAYNIVHDQLNNRNHESDRIELRQLLDLAMLRARHENAIDWTEIDQRFCSAERGVVLATYLDFAEKLLGQPAPNFRHASRREAFATFRRNIERPGRRALADLARRRDPVGVVRKLIGARSWSGGIRLIKAAISRW